MSRHLRYRGPLLLLAVFILTLLGLVRWLDPAPGAAPFQSAADNPPTAPVQPWQASTESDHELLRMPGGSGLENLPPELVTALHPALEPAGLGQWLQLDLGGNGTLTVEVERVATHPNGDVSAHGRGIDGLDRVTLTWGREGLFGRLNSDQGLFLVHTDATGTWLLDLNDERIDVDRFGHDTVGPAAAHAANSKSATQPPSKSANAVTNQPDLHQIDVMFIYPPSMLVRYPGSLIETRLNHLVAIANQAMVDSLAPIVVRQVHHQQVHYNRHQANREALIDLRDALRGQPVPGLANLQELRQTHGADIVALTWPHDIDQRGSCGIAFFPWFNGSDYDPSHGVHIDNDGVSNWSVCSDAVFTHELGHNLNAQHQRSASGNDSPVLSNYAFVRGGRFHTVMGSFGTAEADRYRRLDVFSNPDISCGGIACGSRQPGEGANNAREIRLYVPIVAAYANQVQPGLAERPLPSNPDSDGDGVSDWLDPWPFDPHDGQSPPAAMPPFEFEPRQLRSTEETNDWELLVVSSGSDQVLAFDLDGDFRGVVTEPKADDRGGPILTEASNLALDDEGRLYLLAFGDVRRYDRLSGHQIDIYLDASLPEPRELQSSFPRALGFLTSGELVVLGDNAIERYDANRSRLNFPASPTPQPHPSNWNDLLDLPLRTLAAGQNRLYVAEARHQRILIFDTDSGALLNTLTGPQATPIRDARGLALDGTGGLYLANGSAGDVLHFDLVTGQGQRFIAPDAGGLRSASAVAVGPDGHVYVACWDTHQVLRFDSQTGALLGTTVASGAGGLDQPSALAFAPRLDQIHAGHSGTYMDPTRDGEGWLLEVLDAERAAVSWFTYPPLGDGTGTQAWLVGVGEIEGGRIVFDEMLVTRGSGFGALYDPDSFEMETWGTLEFEFANCNRGTVRYQGPSGWGSGSHPVQRLIDIPGLPCGSAPTSPTSGAPGLTGQWFDRWLSGQGWFLQEVEPGRVWTAWYAYEQDGNQAWVVGTGTVEDNEMVFDEMVLTRGVFFGEDFVSEDVERIPWGTLRFVFSDCDHAVVEYNSVLPEFGSGVLMPERLTRLDGQRCALH